ncbi:MAG: ABC transporter substrate-binding protein [Alkalispirochaeta sp.]
MTHTRIVVSIMVSLVLITGLVFAGGQEEAPATDTESDETVTVRVLTPRWASTGDVRVERQVAFQSVIDSFEAANPNVRVEEVISSASSYDVDVANQIEEGTVEVVWINNPFYPTLQQQGAFADLEPHLSQEDLEDFFPWTIEALKSVNGELGGLWHNTDVRLFFYREDLISDPPTTLSGLQEELDNVLDENPDLSAPYFVSLGHTDAMFHMYGNFVAMGGEVLDDSGRPILLEGDNLDIWVEIFESYGDLVEDGFIPEGAAAARESGVVPFLLSGDVASFVGNSNYGVREINPKLPEEEAELWQATPVLGYEGHPTGRGLSGGWVYSARKIDDDPDLQQAAIDFVIHATGFSAMRQTTKAGGWTPTRESVFTSDTFFSEDRFMAATAEALENSTVRPLVPVSFVFSQVVSDALSRYISGNDAAREVLEEANEELQTEYENL